MANTAKNAILRAKVEGVLVDLMIKSNVENVYFDANTTLSAKLAEIIADLGTKATSTALTEGLATKAEKVHGHEQSEITGLVDALAAKASTESMNQAIAALKQEMLGDTPVEAYNTFTELAKYIEEHQDAADALTEAIGKKADQTTVDGIVQTLNGLGALAQKSKVSESDLDSALAEKVNAAAEGNHSHSNKALLDTYTQTEANLADAVAKKHEHSNAAALDMITGTKINNWDAAEQNAKDYADTKAAGALSDAKTYANGLNTAMNDRVEVVEGKAHEHSNKVVLDGISSEKVVAWDAAEQNAKTYANGLNTTMNGRMEVVEGKAHEHSNKTVLDGITAANIASWNGKAKVYGASETVDLAEGEIFVQLV